MTKRLKLLLKHRADLKASEEVATKMRRECDAELVKEITKIHRLKTEGDETLELDGVKVTVSARVTRKVDSDLLMERFASLPDPVRKLFRFKAEISMGELRNADVTTLTQASTFMTTSATTYAISSVSFE